MVAIQLRRDCPRARVVRILVLPRYGAYAIVVRCTRGCDLEIEKSALNAMLAAF